MMGVSIDTIPADVSGLIVSTLGMTFSIADNPNRALYAGVILAGGGLNAQLASATWNGVTMAEQGVSQLVSVDLKRAESLVA